MTNLAVEVLAARVEGSNEKGRGDVKRRNALAMLGLVGAVALVASLAAATVGNAKPTASPTVVKQSAVIGAPAVPNAAKLRAKYKGVQAHLRGRQRGRRKSRPRPGAREEVHPRHRDQDQGPAASGEVGRVLFTARQELLLQVIGVRRRDDGCRLAGRVRALPGRPEEAARQARQAACAGDRRERHRRRQADRHAVVR